MADTHPIAPERHALLLALAQQAAAYWRKRLEGHGYLSDFDNGDTSRAGETAQVMASMAALRAPRPEAGRLERFEQLLTAALLERMLRKPVPPARDLSHLQGTPPALPTPKWRKSGRGRPPVLPKTSCWTWTTAPPGYCAR